MPGPDAILIQKPAIDFKSFVSLCHQALGYNPASKSDSNYRDMSDTERFLSCLAAMRDQEAPVGLPSGLLNHASFSVLVAASNQDMLDIVQQAAGMSCVVADTVSLGIQIAVITGTLTQWRDAVRAGSDPSVEAPVRRCFNKIYRLFESADLNVWGDLRERASTDQTFFLEDKRNR